MWELVPEEDAVTGSVSNEKLLHTLASMRK